MTNALAAAYAGKSVVITGGSGYIASALLEALGNQPGRVLLVSRRALQQRPGIETLQADIGAEECWRHVVSVADVVFHLASNTSVYAAAQDPAGSMATTVLPVAHLMAAARSAKRVPRVVLASTATLYGLVSVLPVTEAVTPCPVNNYDLHKLFAEKQLVLATEQGLLDGVSLRVANVYGPSSNVSSASDRGVLNKVTAMALRGQTLSVYGGGDYLRDYVYISDVARAFLAAGGSSAVSGRSFNVASGHGTTVRDAFSVVVEQVWKATGKRALIQDVPWPEGADKTEMRNFIGDISALNSAAGWEPVISLKEGVSRMVDHLMHIVGPSQ